MEIIELSEMKGYELRELATKIIRNRSHLAEVSGDSDSHQALMDEELTVVLNVINDRGREIAKKYKKTFRPLDLRGIKADMDAVLGRGGLR